MQSDVEKVARAVRLARLVRAGNSPEAAAICAAAIFIGTNELADTAAAMAATLELAAAAFVALPRDGPEHLPHEFTQNEAADWLTQRAKEIRDGE